MMCPRTWENRGPLIGLRYFQRPPHLLGWLAGLVLGLTLATPTSAVAGPTGGMRLCPEFGQRYTCVVDGDTVWLQGIKIRLEGIDAPEVSQPQCSRERRLGNQATERLRQLLSGGQIVVKRVGRADEDRYGRKLRTLYVNGVDVGTVLVREGLARIWPNGPERWCR